MYNRLLLTIAILLILRIHEVIAQTAYASLFFSKEDAIYTTYAAAQTRSKYKVDQAYDLMWYPSDRSAGMKSSQGGEIGLLFAKGNRYADKVEDYYTAPVISGSYSDMVTVNYRPFKSIDVEALYCVFSSSSLILEYTFTNRSEIAVIFTVYPYYYRNQGFHDIEANNQGHISFIHEAPGDNWMKEHAIPFCERFDNEFIYTGKSTERIITDAFPSDSAMLGLLPLTEGAGNNARLILLKEEIILQPGETKVVRLIRNVMDHQGSSQGPVLQQVHTADLVKVREENEKAYSRIPKLESFSHLQGKELRDRMGLYYSSFSLLRQCMMPPEGACSKNYYVFSREPKWGWGYGGQVFHESLSMLAYAYMDPIGAMNSQRIYMERQQKDGYINYRTGPYLDETIETNGMKTSSAPWFSYINHEIYKITKDNEYLKESYESGRKLYNWFVRNRDKDTDGLAEWGGDGTLESVRDGRVAIWDNVSKPENLEGPDLNSMLVKEAIALSKMAEALKMDKESSIWLDLARKRALRINQQCWDSATGFYYNTLLSTNGFTFLSENDLKIKEIIGFLPMWAGLCHPEQAHQLLLTLSNPEEFWRPFGIPTLSAKETYYNPMGYWNGPVWVQWQYLIFRGLIDYNYSRTAQQLAWKVIDQMTWHLKNDHTFWEFYSPDDRHAGWNHSYIWAGLAARFLIDLDQMRKW